MIPRTNKSMLEDFRSVRRGYEEKQEVEKPSIHVPPRNQRRKDETTPYSTFKNKLNTFDKSVKDFKTRDFVYYFREVAEQNGYKYVISNIKKDMAIFKKLSQEYKALELCAMIEFLYESDQDYLDKTRLSPNILASTWVNTVYADMKLWVKDEYTPKSNNSKTKKSVQNREWTSTEDTTKVGEW